MKHASLAEAGLPYVPCRYGASRLPFRGPRRSLEAPYIAFMGSTDTFGKFIRRPFPAQVEDVLSRTCVNFGCVNAGIDAFLQDASILSACRNADLTVMQVMGAQNLSNRFYTVHPRRNDRFLKASTVLRAIYAEIDFADFSFTRHMLQALHEADPTRFEIVREELQAAWTARMKTLVSELGGNVVLLWFAASLPPRNDELPTKAALSTEPLFITREMIEAVRPHVRQIVEVQPPGRARDEGTDGMVFRRGDRAAAEEVLGLAAHRQAAFDACQFLIDEIKLRVPIWKKEVYTDGRTEWVKGSTTSVESDS